MTQASLQVGDVGGGGGRGKKCSNPDTPNIITKEAEQKIRNLKSIPPHGHSLRTWVPFAHIPGSYFSCNAKSI